MSAEIISHLGANIPLDPGIISPLIADRIRQGQYEHKEAQRIALMIEPGERILEIGGGIGFTSTLCCKNPNTQAIRVFEANPSLCPFIQNVHSINEVRNAEVVNAVLTNDPNLSLAEFYLRTDFWASSLSPRPHGYQAVIPVKTRQFREEIEEFKPTLIICDLEGGEVDLFNDATLTGVKRVFLELHPRVTGKRGLKTLFDAMSARNFCYEPRFSSGAVVMFSFLQ